MIKCVIWDLDNTIWQGIISEDKDVEIREGIFDVIRLFESKGIIQTISSRNDEGPVLEKLEDLDLIKYFIYPQISWEHKSIGIKRILNGLHFKPSDVIFIDDNIFERDQVKEAFPLININSGENIRALHEIAFKTKSFNSIEAKNRLELYRTEETRLLDKKNLFSGNEKEFLHSCNIHVQLLKANHSELIRIKELVDRTNQLNSTGYRYSIEEIEAMINKPEFEVYIVQVEDKYGNYGRSGLLILENKLDGYFVKQLIVSCRLMGKGIAQTLLYFAYKRTLDKEFNNLYCLFKRNQFNRQMILLFTGNNFLRVSNENEEVRYYLDLKTAEIELPSWVKLLDKTTHALQ
ncbi:HAD-IIIC family phosphatase [Metabacillus halosaccharovorans]|uniref:HAD-IIIC family phosphatase n=1 Tax=Metabacillus halosaccharovorans TaxID=930124 RepID=UPI00203BF419|nr:HAD-IIIC family phosphatase [Metabacillus halosaccharovorans]MCM3444734.1 HAD-IIIC family phosphatase [Metabacillus halosaccharovorans]